MLVYLFQVVHPGVPTQLPDPQAHQATFPHHINPRASYTSRVFFSLFHCTLPFPSSILISGLGIHSYTLRGMVLFGRQDIGQTIVDDQSLTLWNRFIGDWERYTNQNTLRYLDGTFTATTTPGSSFSITFSGTSTPFLPDHIDKTPLPWWKQDIRCTSTVASPTQPCLRMGVTSSTQRRTTWLTGTMVNYSTGAR